MADFDATPIEEFNKKVKEQTKEVEKSTSSLRAPFRQLIGQIQETNSEFAKIAAESIGGTQDTMKGLMTQRRKLKITERLETQDYAQASKDVKASLKRQAQLEEDKYQQEKSFVDSKKELLEQDKKNIATINLNKKKADLDEEYLTANKARRKEITDDLATVDADISERQTFITKELTSQNEEFIKVNEEKLKDEKEGRHAAAKLVDETNTKLEEQLAEAEKTENYDKFTKGIKTLTGGLVDINAVLDPIAETWGAVRDVSSVIATPFKAMSSSIGGFFKSEKEENEELREENEEREQKDLKKKDKLQEKSNKSLFSFVKGMNPLTLLFGALVIACLALLARFTDLDDWIKTFTGNKDEDAMDELADLTEEFKKAFESEKDPEKRAELEKEFLQKQKELLEQQNSRIAQNNIQDGLDITGDALTTTVGANLGVRTGDAVQDIADAWRNPTPTAVNPNTGKVDMRLKENKNPSTWKRFKEAAKRTLKPKKLLTKGNLAMTTIGVGLTGQEVYADLQELETAREKIEYLRVNQIITPEEYDQALIDLEEMGREAYVKPSAMAIAGAAGSLLVGGILSFTGIGTVPGIALATAGGITLAAAAGIGTDMKMQGDDKIYDLLSSKGINIDPEVDTENLEIMKESANDVGEFIKQQNNELNDLQNPQAVNQSNAIGVSNVNNSSNSNISVNSPPQNLDPTNSALQTNWATV